MKHLHRLIVTSATYRLDAIGEPQNLERDPDNIYLWRAPTRRMEAELVRDNLLYLAGDLDQAMGGPEIPHTEGLTSKRRSVYLRIAAEKEVEFLNVFDGPSVTECYQRHPTVRPQQALALANSPLAHQEAQRLAQFLSQRHPDARDFVDRAFQTVLARPPTPEETALCRGFLQDEAEGKDHAAACAKRRANLVLVLFNHNDFVSIR
jgi:hypothetical protein